ncbi:MAG: SDR family NAD(P)-dependent oxidoreductase [Spirochaetaceae bacterium]
MKEIVKIATQLRGLTQIEDRLSKILYSGKLNPNCNNTLEIADNNDLEKSLTEAFTGYVKDHGVFPDCVNIAGKGSYLIDSDFDESNHHPLNRKVSVVTGGAQGFGEGLVRDLVTYGSTVFIADMNIDGAKKLAAELNESKGQTVAYAVAVNVTDEDSVEQMVEEIALTVGGIDVFISNAGVLKAGSVKEMSLKDFNFVTSVDYTGYFICTKFVSVLMAEQNKYSNNYLTDIIQINSKSGLEGSNKNGAYAGAKFGGIGLTQSFALELISDNIKVNSIAPGNFLDGPLWSDPDRGLFVQYLNTGKVPGATTIADVRAFYEGKVPMKRGCTTEDVMKAVTYIVDQKYETGQAVPVTGGQVMLK